jgi:thiosulfate dehydrogenase
MFVQLCDGETSTKVKGVRPDERLTPEQAQAVSNELMRMWLDKADPAKAAAWMKEQAAAQTPQPQTKAPARRPAGSKSQTAAQTAGRDEQPNDFTDRDFSIWKRELDREIKYGDEIFHSDKLIGSTNGIACAMRHPNAANAHPETYPKFQIQLRRVALLRDMINWRIEQPARGKRLEPDDPKMRALEAYIMSQRKGVPMEYGKH